MKTKPYTKQELLEAYEEASAHVEYLAGCQGLSNGERKAHEEVARRIRKNADRVTTTREVIKP